MSELSEKCQTSSVNSAGSSSSSHSTSSKSLGVHKFCSKLRHKIEDNLNLNSARLTNKLRKSSRHSMSMSALSGIADATTGKYTANKSTTKTKTLQLPTIKQTSGMLKYKRVVKKSAEQKTAQKAEGLSFDTATTHKEIDSSVYVDSDDEYQLPSLSWTKQSLEDEIFEELEKAAHDENKLNSVLKSFDRILTDFQDEAVKPTQINANETETIKREIPHKLSKARTTLCEQNLPKKLSTTSKLNKSVLDVANTPTIMPVASKIPIWKALPLSKRSKSFCNAPVLETAQKPLAVQPKNISMGSRAISYTTLPRLKQTQRATLKNNYNNNNSNKLVKSKTELNVKTKPQQQQQQQQNRNCNKSSNLRSHTNSDELLDKCLEKGQQILRKIETLGEQGARLQAVTKNSVNKSTQQKDTVKYLAEKGRQNSDALSDDSGHISNEADVQHTTSGLCESSSSTLESLCDIETDTTQLTTTMSTPRSTKIIELLQKFENTAKLNMKAVSATTTAMSANIKKSNSIKSAETTTTTTNTALTTANKLNTQFTQNICTSLKVSEVEPVHCVQTHIEIFPNYSKEILFRSGVLSDLEAKRDELLSDRIIQLQAYCRSYLARKQLARRRVQELAVRCIQRNVRAFLVVRDWPWWRLLVRVTPLLNVHRTEEQLKSAHEELAMLRAKLDKCEHERNELKNKNEKIEGKLSEMTVDLAEERSTANIASERYEAETAERLKLEKELNDSQAKVKNLQETTEKLEMELICAKSDLNGSIEEEDGENEDNNGGAVYKLKYERVARELEFTKRRLQSQHEHDLEQLVGLKKQLEKKLADAYEEVEEQRQVVGQWKRKAQKMTNEMNDLRMLLEEQNARNNLLEKKQRKFDAECQALQDATRQEKQAKERFSREKDVLIAEKFTLEQNLADTRLELELKEEKMNSLQRELEEMTFGGGTEEEVAQMRRAKNELERRLKEQEEELDEMAGQVQLLEQAKLRLEMSLETMRKEARREAQQRDEELEEARGSAYKKIKALECQLETEHEERTLLLREKHELERRLSSLEDRDRIDLQAEEATNQKLRRDLRKYKALLKDAHAQLERLKAETPGKALIRQLRNQLEDAETARALAMKARQSAEAELAEVQALFEESHRARNDAEDRANQAHRDRAELQAQIEENEEEMAELMKKYSGAVKQLNSEQIAVSEYEFKISELEAERNNYKEQVTELQQRLDNIENQADPSAAMMSKRLELRTKELESRLELEQATRSRLEVQMNRHKEALEKVQQELSQAKVREMQAQEALKKSQKSLRDMREEFHTVSAREQDSINKRKDLEKKMEQLESEVAALKNDLRLALQRIADLQQAMEEGDDDDDVVSESDDSQSSETSLQDLEDRLRPINVKRTSISARNGDVVEPTVSKTRTLMYEKEDNSPRVTLTSPSSPHIHTLAAAAKAAEMKATMKATTAAKTTTANTLSPNTATTLSLQQNGKL